MHQYLVGYRHRNGEVEGFKGFGFTPQSAKEDAYRQIKLKLEHFMSVPDSFNVRQLIESANALNFGDEARKEMEQLRQDWHSKARYVQLASDFSDPTLDLI